MRIKRIILVSFLLLLAGCGGTGTPPAVTPQVVRVQYTAAAQPWLADLSVCAAQMDGIAIHAVERVASTLDANSADLLLRLGPPPGLVLPSFQVGEDELVVIVHPQNPVASLTRGQLLGLFTGQFANWSALGGNDQPVTLWVLDGGEDIQSLFVTDALGGLSIPAGARLASGLGKLRDAVAADPGAVGVISGHYLAGNVRALRLPDEISASLKFPLLAITPVEPQGVVRDLLACLQK